MSNSKSYNRFMSSLNEYQSLFQTYEYHRLTGNKVMAGKVYKKIIVLLEVIYAHGLDADVAPADIRRARFIKQDRATKKAAAQAVCQPREVKTRVKLENGVVEKSARSSRKAGPCVVMVFDNYTNKYVPVAKTRGQVKKNSLQ